MEEEEKKEIKVELLKYPTEADWAWVKTCTLNTVGKKSLKAPTEEWKKRLLEAEHSPIRELWFGFRIWAPYYSIMQFCRHHEGVNHYVQSQRNDRQDNYDRTKAPQGEMISYVMSVNAAELIFIAHRRLCFEADQVTREVMQKICEQAISVCPALKGLLVPLCIYRNNKCTEMFPCGKFPWSQKEEKK